MSGLSPSKVSACFVALVGIAAAEFSCPSLPPAGAKPNDQHFDNRPKVYQNIVFINGQLQPYNGPVQDVTSPVFDNSINQRATIGQLPQMDEKLAMKAVDAAARAWDKGQGLWPQMTLAARIDAIVAVMNSLKENRDEIVRTLMWEIAKSASDAAKEFDRTMLFVDAVITELRSDPSLGSGFSEWSSVSGVGVRVRRGPIGVMLALAPFNYPLNEMYAMLIPSLLMGNTAVLKLPAIGGLVHMLTAEAFAKHLPPGVINFVSGSGRKTMGPIMESGLVDVLGFIGGTRGADALIKAHPKPHRLKVFAQLEGKNLGIVMKDADLDDAVKQCLLGALSYNGQRCTAIKLIMVHEAVADVFVSKFITAVSALKAGLPWEEGVSITPLPELAKPKILEELIADALKHGATLANAAQGGAELRGALFTPAIVDHVKPSMRLFHEEQFGPVVPIARFADVADVKLAIKESWNGQQAAIFTKDDKVASPLVDTLSTVVGRININVQCGRSPDNVPFSGRRSSAMGTMSVLDALRAFSVETVIAYPANSEVSSSVAQGLDTSSNFFAAV